MGAAKQRGTLEQRIEQSREAANAQMEVVKAEVEQLAELETRQMEAIGNFVDQRILPQMERQYGAAMRIDFSHVPLKLREDIMAFKDED